MSKLNYDSDNHSDRPWANNLLVTLQGISKRNTLRRITAQTTGNGETDMEHYFQDRSEKKLKKAMTGIREHGVMAGAEELRYVLEMHIKDEGLIDAVNHIEEFGFEGLTVEEREVVRDMINRNIDSKKTAKSDMEKEFDRMLIGAILAYVLLFLWIASIFFFIYWSHADNCDKEETKANALETDPSNKCKELYSGHSAILQNVSLCFVIANYRHECSSHYLFF